MKYLADPKISWELFQPPGPQIPTDLQEITWRPQVATPTEAYHLSSAQSSLPPKVCLNSPNRGS